MRPINSSKRVRFLSAEADTIEPNAQPKRRRTDSSYTAKRNGDEDEYESDATYDSHHTSFQSPSLHNCQLPIRLGVEASASILEMEVTAWNTLRADLHLSIRKRISLRCDRLLAPSSTSAHCINHL
jgi:hypothetical protein